MRVTGWILAVGFMALLTTCSKKDSGPSSIEGSWIYITPDGKIVSNFDFVKNSSGGWDIQNQSITVNGQVGYAEYQINGFNLPDISSLRFNANDNRLTYPYSIAYTGLKVSSDFKSMTVQQADYTYPWGKTVTVKNISIVRP